MPIVSIASRPMVPFGMTADNILQVGAEQARQEVTVGMQDAANLKQVEHLKKLGFDSNRLLQVARVRAGDWERENENEGAAFKKKLESGQKTFTLEELVAGGGVIGLEEADPRSKLHDVSVDAVPTTKIRSSVFVRWDHNDWREAEAAARDCWKGLTFDGVALTPSEKARMRARQQRQRLGQVVVPRRDKNNVLFFLTMVANGPIYDCRAYHLFDLIPELTPSQRQRCDSFVFLFKCFLFKCFFDLHLSFQDCARFAKVC